MVVQPDFVQIISWNDYGESHYIGPLRDIDNYQALIIGKEPFNYVANMPHDGWRLLLPCWIDTYKYGKASLTKERLVTWYRPNPSYACNDGSTTGNTASQLQIEFAPTDIVQNKIFFSALLTSSADISVTIGGAAVAATWDDIPSGGIGVYHGSAACTDELGEVVVTLSRGNTICQVKGKAISSTCRDGYSNWNAWVGSASGPDIGPVSPALSISEQSCIEGSGKGNFQGLCESTCRFGYCPVGACVCLRIGPPRKLPDPTGVQGYPIEGEGSSYIGLCSFACNYGFCPPNACGTVKVPLTEPTVSPFLPQACTSGTGVDSFIGLCQFSCNFGFCPIHRCTCTETGPLVSAPPRNTSIEGHFIDDGTDDAGLCNFACQHGYCPPTCVTTDKNKDDDGSEDDDPNDKCNDDDRTYSTKDMPAGQYMPWYLMEPENAAASGKQYITIVNLTPHQFTLDHTHSYQMDTFDSVTFRQAAHARILWTIPLRLVPTQ